MNTMNAVSKAHDIENSSFYNIFLIECPAVLAIISILIFFLL